MAPQPRALTPRYAPKRGAALFGALLAAAVLAACAARGLAPPGTPAAEAVPGSAESGSPVTPSTSSSAPGGAPLRQFHLGPAANALVTQAHTQAGAGEYAAAGATLERALRIEPENPLLWVELGRVQMGQGNAAQADAMGRKALALATGDPAAEAAAWRLIADSLHSRGRTAEALDAEQRAASLMPQ